MKLIIETPPMSYIGDILFQWVAVCTDLDLDPNDVIEKNVAKLIDRKERDKLEGSGDKR